MQGKGRLYLLIGVAVILVAAAGLYWTNRDPGVPKPTDTATIEGVCLACKQEVKATYHATERQPAVCPLCGERAVYGLHYCFDCKLRFVPNLEPAPDGGPPRKPIVTTCPVCGGSNVSGYIPIDPEQKDAELAPLPKWPQ